MITTIARKLNLLAALAFCTISVAQTTRRVPADYPTVQAAVIAADAGDRILVAAGIYEEQIVIFAKDLTLIGRPGAVLRAPTNMVQTLLPASERRAVVGVLGARVTIHGFEVDGARRGNSNPDFNGIVYLGASGLVQDCKIHGVRNDPLSFGGSSAPIRAINLVAFGTPVVDIDIAGNECYDNFDGIAVSGDDSSPNLTRVHATIRGNTVRGAGPTADVSQVGIWMMYGVDGQVRHNRVSDHDSTDPLAISVGILGGVTDIPGLELPSIDYLGNECFHNEVGLATIHSHRALVLGNRSHGSTYAGIAVSGEGNRVLFNTVSDAPIGVGLAGAESVIFGTAVRTRVLFNRIYGCAQPIREETGVTGTVSFGNHVRP